MTARGAVALGLLIAAAGVAPASASTALPTLTADVVASASRTGYVRVRLTRTLDLTRFNAYVSPPVFTGAGAVGVALLPDRPGSRSRNVVIVRVPTDGGYQLVESQAQGFDPVTGEEGAPRLRPGVYRLFFLTRGGGSVRLRLPGLPAGTRRLTTRTPVPWMLGEYAAPHGLDGSAPPAWDATFDFAGHRAGHLFGALWLRSAVTAYLRGGACYFTEATRSGRDRPLCTGGADGGSVERVGPYVGRRSWLWHGSVYDRAPGEQALRLYYADAGRVEAAGALMFFLPAA